MDDVEQMTICVSQTDGQPITAERLASLAADGWYIDGGWGLREDWYGQSAVSIIFQRRRITDCPECGAKPQQWHKLDCGQQVRTRQRPPQSAQTDEEVCDITGYRIPAKPHPLPEITRMFS